MERSRPKNLVLETKTSTSSLNPESSDRKEKVSLLILSHAFKFSMSNDSVFPAYSGVLENSQIVYLINLNHSLVNFALNFALGCWIAIRDR